MLAFEFTATVDDAVTGVLIPVPVAVTVLTIVLPSVDGAKLVTVAW